VPQQDRLHRRLRDLQAQWERLSQLLQAVQQQYDLETRGEERLRLQALLTQREAERQQVEAQMQGLEQALAGSAGPGSVAPVPPGPAVTPPLATQPVTLFYSYARADLALRDQLATHLALLQREGIIGSWYDRLIEPGTVWEPQILGRLESAEIILLLVSADFLASEYCWREEVSRAMARHQAGTARVIPILLRPADWATAPFHVLQALPSDARPVTSWPDRDAAFVDIARGIRQVAQRLRQERLAQQEAEQRAGQIDWAQASHRSPPSQQWFDGEEPRPF